MLGVEVFRDKQGQALKSRDGKKKKEEEEEERGADEVEGGGTAAVEKEAELENGGEDQSSEPKIDSSNKES